MGQPVSVGDIIWYSPGYSGRAFKALVVFVCDNRSVVAQRGVFRHNFVIREADILGIAESAEEKAMNEVLKEQKHYG